MYILRSISRLYLWFPALHDSTLVVLLYMAFLQFESCSLKTGEEEDQLGYLSPLENDDSSIVAESYESISEVFGPSSDDNSRVLGRELAASWENTWEAIRSHRNLIQTRRMPRVREKLLVGHIKHSNMYVRMHGHILAMVRRRNIAIVITIKYRYLIE